MRAWFAGTGAIAVALELAAGVVALVHLGPAWIALYPVACAVASAAVTSALWRLLAPRPGWGGGGPSCDDGDGGGDGDGGPSPGWWPEFERELAEYSASRERTPAGPRA